jgi:integrase
VLPQRVRGVLTGRFVAFVGRTYLGVVDDEEAGWRRVNAALRIDSDHEPDLVSVYGARWFVEREEAGHVRDVKNEKYIWDRHIAGAGFFDWPLRKVKPKHVQAWLGKLLRTEAVSPRRSARGIVYKPLGRTLSRSSVTTARRILRAMFAQARIEGKVSSNPVDGVPVPKVDRVIEDEDTWSYLTVEEIKALFEVLPDARTKAIYAVAIYGGLRQGEILGLRWTDVVLDGARPHLKVRRSFDHATKTAGSRRDVPLLDPVRVALREWKAAVQVARLDPVVPRGKIARQHARQGARARANSKLVFPSEHGGCYGRSYDAAWSAKRGRPVFRVEGDERRVARDRSAAIEVKPGWRERAGVRTHIRFHDLRHTCASHLVMGTWTARPLTLYEVKNWLGHDSVKTTQRYAHLSPEGLHSAAAGPDRPKIDLNTVAGSSAAPVSDSPIKS